MGLGIETPKTSAIITHQTPAYRHLLRLQEHQLNPANYPHIRYSSKKLF